jgi:hypothetical protein
MRHHDVETDALVIEVARSGDIVGVDVGGTNLVVGAMMADGARHLVSRVPVGRQHV